MSISALGCVVETLSTTHSAPRSDRTSWIRCAAAMVLLAGASLWSPDAAAQPIDPDDPQIEAVPGEGATPGAGAPDPAEEVPAFEPDPELQHYVSVTTKITQREQLAPAAVTVITGEQIQRFGYRSVGEALAHVPGLYVSYDLQNHHVGVRGIFGGARAASRALKVMINGKSFSFVHSGVYYLGPDFVPVSAIERIEVMKGPASALYGAGALVAAINIVTKRPPYTGELSGGATVHAVGGIGGQEVGGGAVLLNATSERLFVMAGVTGFYGDRSGLVLDRSSPVLNPGKRPELSGVGSSDTARPIGVFGRVEYALLGGRLELDGFGQFYDYDAAFHDQAPLSEDNRVDLAHGKAVVGYGRRFASGLSFKLNGGVALGSAGSSDRLRFAGAQFARTREFEYQEYSGQLEGRYDFTKWGAWVLAGVDFAVDREHLQRYFEVDPVSGEKRIPDPAPPDPPQETLTNVAGYAQVLWPLANWLRLTAGLRFDYQNIYGAAISARGAVVLPLRDDLVVKLMFGRSYKAPSAEQLFGVAANFGDIEGNDDLAPQYLTGGEVNVDYFITRWLSVSLAGYMNRLTDGIAYVEQDNFLVPQLFDATSFGGELVLRQANDLGKQVRLTTDVALALQDTHTDEQEIGGVVLKNVPDNEGVPQLSAWARLALVFPKLYSRLAVSYRYVGSRTPSQTNLVQDGTPQTDLSDPSYTLGDYHLLDLVAGTTDIALDDRRSISGLLRVTNVLNRSFSEIGFNGVDVPSLGTTAWLQLRLTI